MTAPPATEPPTEPPTGSPGSSRGGHVVDTCGRSTTEGRSQRETAPLHRHRRPWFPCPRPPVDARARSPPGPVGTPATRCVGAGGERPARPPSNSTSRRASSPPSASPMATPPVSMSLTSRSTATAAPRSVPRAGTSAGDPRRRRHPTSPERANMRCAASPFLCHARISKARRRSLLPSLL